MSVCLFRRAAQAIQPETWQPGMLVGPPEDVAADPASHTGRYLKAVLDDRGTA